MSENTDFEYFSSFQQLHQSLRLAEQECRSVSFLIEAATRLGGDLDYQLTLNQAVELAVPFLAEGCWIDLLKTDPWSEGEFVRVASHGWTPDEGGIEISR
jgi:hypothetical protein